MFNSFVKPTVKVIKKIDKMGDIAMTLAKLAKQDVLVGVPQEKASRRGGEITNAELAYIHTHGSPINNIPARPFLEPSIFANRDRLAIIQKRIIQAALEGKTAQAQLQMNALGLLAQSAVKGWFVDPRNGWPPNAPATIEAKGSDKPLIDTGALRNSISYVIRDKS